MKAVVYEGPYRVAVEDVADPRIERPTDAVVRVTTAAICGSDLHMYEGRTAAAAGLVFGHENMGIVEEVGTGVVSVKPGDRVSLPFNVACGLCENCQRGKTGFFNCLHLPPGTEHELDFAMLADVFPTGYHATELAQVSPGETVAVYGAGPVGLMAAYSAFIRGAAKVFVVDKVPDRLRLAENIGAVPIDYSDSDPVEQIRAQTDGAGTHKGIDAVGYQAKTGAGEEQPASKEVPLGGAPDAYARFDLREDGYSKVVLKPQLVAV